MPYIGFRLITLGTVTLTDRDGVPEPTLARRRRKLAVLTVLAMSRRPVGRDRLAEMFWGTEEDARARHSLADSLSNLRRVLGPDSVTTRQLEIALSPTCPLTVDALELIEAAERRDHARVVELYRGPFLDGLAVADSATFDHWAERIRVQLHRHWVEACSHQCLALARARRWVECAAIARRWFDTEPLSSDAALYVLNALKASATSEAYSAALDEYAQMEARLEREFEQSPAHEVARLAASIRDELANRRVEIVQRPDVVPGVTVARNTEELDACPAPRTRRLGASRVASMSLVALLLLTATSFTTLRVEPTTAGESFSRPVVAVLDIHNVAGDSASAWLELSVPQLIASEVSRVPGVDVVAPDFVRQARDAMRLERSRAVSRGDVARFGRRIGARWIVTGGIQRVGTTYVLDVAMHDATAGTPPRPFRVSDTNLVALTDQAAAKLASFAVPTDQSARKAETGSARAARQAGISAAKAATTTSATETPASTPGSRGATP